jgi:hypothetical protein
MPHSAGLRIALDHNPALDQKVKLERYAVLLEGTIYQKFPYIQYHLRNKVLKSGPPRKKI